MRLLRSDIPDRGCLFAGSKGAILYPKGFVWSEGGILYSTETYELTIPQGGTLKYGSIGGVFDLLWYLLEEETTIETQDDFKRRLKHQIQSKISTADNPESHPETINFSADWIDRQFTHPSRYEIVPKLQKALDVLAGMGKVIRGTSNANQKLAEAKYRQKDSSKEAAKGRRKVSLDTSKEMRKAQKWIKDNPGKDFSDYLSFQETEIKVND